MRPGAQGVQRDVASAGRHLTMSAASSILYLEDLCLLSAPSSLATMRRCLVDFHGRPGQAGHTSGRAGQSARPLMRALILQVSHLVTAAGWAFTPCSHEQRHPYLWAALHQCLDL